MQDFTYVRVPGNKMSPERLDTGYYSKEYFEADLAVEQSGLKTVLVGDISEPWCFGAYALCNEIVWTISADGIPYLKAEALGSPLINLDGLAYITRETHELLLKSKLQPGDIIVSTSGTIGRCAVLPDCFPEANSNQDTIKFNPKSKDFDNHFIVAWIASKYGQIFLRREAGGAIQQHVYLNNFRKLILVNPLTVVQKYIGDKVRWAERLRGRSERISNVVNQILEALFHGYFNVEDLSSVQAFIKSSSILKTSIDRRAKSPNRKKYQRIDADEIVTERLDANFYKPEYVENYRTLKSNNLGVNTLSSVANRIACGPFGSNLPSNLYQESGIPLYRVQNVRDGKISEAGLVFLSEATSSSLSSCCFYSGDILVAKSGDLGRVAYVPSSVELCNVTQDVVGISVDRNRANPQYISAFLSSKSGRVQIERWGQGNVQQHLNMPSIREFLWIDIKLDIQNYIGDQVKQIEVLQACSSGLTTAAKLLVEALIEGKLSEADLKAAQEGLEQGDTTLDRDILTRLSSKGIDSSNELPLFPNLDDLYTALSQLEEAELTEAGGTNNGQASNVYTLHEQLTLPLASETASGSYPTTQEVLG
jgi:type I restriction enzyme S subunit